MSARIRPLRATTQGGFTLIEILLVVIIIGILAGLAIPRFAGRTRDAEVAAARTDVDRISTAISLYELDNGEYPRALQDLVQEPAHARNWRGPYFERAAVPRDPWGQEYVYVFPGVNNRHSYDLRSLGPDGVESEDDITNWQ